MSQWVRVTYVVVLSAMVIVPKFVFAMTSLMLEDRQAARETLSQQRDALSHQQSSCPKDYKALYSGDTVRMSFFYGYEDAVPLMKDTFDKMNSAAMIEALTEPCSSGFGACGFKIYKRESSYVRMKKKVRGKTVLLDVYWASHSEQDADNYGPKQSQQSGRVLAQFHYNLVNSDMVFYIGHSRGGSGLGFKPTRPGDIFPQALKLPLKKIVKSVSNPKSRLKTLGIFGCDSEKYYRDAIHSANPNLSLIVAKEEMLMVEVEQFVLGAFNSLITQRCEKERDESMTSSMFPGKAPLKYLRKKQR